MIAIVARCDPLPPKGRGPRPEIPALQGKADATTGFQTMGATALELAAGARTVWINGAAIGFGGLRPAQERRAAVTLAPKLAVRRLDADQFGMQAIHRIAA